MNITRSLGTVALAAGSSVLLSAPVLGHELLAEVTGLLAVPLYVLCVLTIVLGAIAIKVGSQDDQEVSHFQGGKCDE